MTTTRSRQPMCLNVPLFDAEANARGWRTLAEQATALGISEGNLSRVKRRQRGAGHRFIDAATSALQIDREQLFHPGPIYDPRQVTR